MKRRMNSKNRDFKSCLSARSAILDFSIAPHLVIAFPTLQQKKQSLSNFFLNFFVQFLGWFTASFMHCFLYSYRSSNYRDKLKEEKLKQNIKSHNVTRGNRKKANVPIAILEIDELDSNIIIQFYQQHQCYFRRLKVY